MTTKDGLARLEGALEQRKEVDAQAMQAIRLARADLEAEIRAVEAAAEAAARDVDAHDLSAYAALDRYRAQMRARLADLAAQRAVLLSREEAARDTLARSNGEVEAVRRLMGAPRPT